MPETLKCFARGPVGYGVKGRPACLPAACLMWSLATAASVEPRHNDVFNTWMRTHAKVYPSMEARRAALEVFEANDRMIEEHNARNVSFTLGHNAYSDLMTCSHHRIN